MADLLILNGAVVSPAGSEALDIAVDGETVTALGPRGSLGSEARKASRSTARRLAPTSASPRTTLWNETSITVNGTIYNAWGLLYNNSPTPKFQPDRQTCWQALADGRLQVVATDHALVSLNDRFEVMSTMVDNMQAGQAAVELRVPLL